MASASASLWSGVPNFLGQNPMGDSLAIFLLILRNFSVISEIILPPFLDVRCIVFCENFQNIRCMAGLWDFFYTI
jgi:hypothetical protein